MDVNLQRVSNQTKLHVYKLQRLNESILEIEVRMSIAISRIERSNRFRNEQIENKNVVWRVLATEQESKAIRDMSVLQVIHSHLHNKITGSILNLNQGGD